MKEYMDEYIHPSIHPSRLVEKKRSPHKNEKYNWSPFLEKKWGKFLGRDYVQYVKIYKFQSPNQYPARVAQRSDATLASRQSSSNPLMMIDGPERSPGFDPPLRLQKAKTKRIVTG